MADFVTSVTEKSVVLTQHLPMLVTQDRMTVSTASAPSPERLPASPAVTLYFIDDDAISRLSGQPDWGAGSRYFSIGE
jgi:hypothetical protein